MSLYSAVSVIDMSSKYKFLWKLPLEDVEMVKSPSQATNKDSIQKMIGRLDEDLSVLGHISKLSETLSFPHQSLDEAIKELMVSVHRDLAEKQSLAFGAASPPTRMELTATAGEGSFLFEFSSPDSRSAFEQAFEDAKKKLAMKRDQWRPAFLKAIPIMKTRSGMQFSCASPSYASSLESSCEVWVCNSDGYVGQVCLLNIRDEPTVEACIAVCSARITCIAAVPGFKGKEHGIEPAPAPALNSATPRQHLHISIGQSSAVLEDPPSEPAHTHTHRSPTQVPAPFDSDDSDDDEDTPTYRNEEGPIPNELASSSLTTTVAASSETTSSEEEQDFSTPSSSSSGAPAGGVATLVTTVGESPGVGLDGRALRRSSRGSFTHGSLEELLGADGGEASQSSMWLGTEDGCIHVYQSSDNIRNRKNSMKMQHNAAVLCIVYLDNKVFVSLANGEVVVYRREAGSFWDPRSSRSLALALTLPTGSADRGPVTKMVAVGGALWCGARGRVLVVDASKLELQRSFSVDPNSYSGGGGSGGGSGGGARAVTSMAAHGSGAWLALHGSAVIRFYDATTAEALAEVDVAPAVHRMLAGSDAIIRQHKAACLRVTALSACQDTLWVGTSAGVVLTLPIQAVGSSPSLSGTPLLNGPMGPIGSTHGHTGHVRFLTSIELPQDKDVSFPPHGTTECTQSPVDNDNGDGSAHPPPLQTSCLVISGGDGYEDFRLTNSSETMGRDDSTNHLLLWRV